MSTAAALTLRGHEWTNYITFKWSWKLRSGALRNRLYNSSNNNTVIHNEGRSHGAAGNDSGGCGVFDMFLKYPSPATARLDP